MKVRRYFATTAIVAVSLAQGAVAQTVDRAKLANETAAAFATSYVRFGATMTGAALQSQPEIVYVAPADGGAAAAALQEVSQTYVSRRGRLQGEIGALQGVVDHTADLVAATSIAASGGSTAVPVAIIRGAFQGTTDQYFAGERAAADASVRAFLAENQNKILRDANLTYEQLQEKKPEEIEALLAKGARTFSAFEAQVKDPALKDMGRSLIVSAIISTQRSTLVELDRQNAKIGDLKGNVAALQAKHDAFAKQTYDALVSQEKSIDVLSSAVSRLDTTMTAIDRRIAGQEREMAFVQDFMFDKMDPAKKAAALEAGFMAARFKCADGTTGCDRAKLKGELIERFKTEAEVKKAVETAGAVMTNAQGVLQIAANLGINTGDAGQLVGYGVAAVNAFSAAATGNYVGALVSITGAFAKRGPDPQMKFLAAQFKQINAKLDTIIKNQVKLSEQIDALSLKLDENNKALNKRLDTIEVRLERVRKLQAAEANKEWLPCNNLYVALVTAQRAAADGSGPDFKFDQASSTFASVEHASLFARSNQAAARGCVAQVENRKVLALGAYDWFGNFLTVATNVGASDADLDALDADRDAAFLLLRSYGAANNLPLWRAYQSLATPLQTIGAVRARSGVAFNAAAPCATGGALSNDRLWNLLCVGAGATPVNADKAATAGLSVSMDTQRTREVVDWMLLEQALVDVESVRSTGERVTTQEVLRYPWVKAVATGEEHTERALLLLDAAMANVAMVNGDLMVEAVLEALRTAPTTGAAEQARKARLEAARLVLANHPHLRQNVATVLLADRFGAYSPDGTRTTAPLRPDAYQVALTMAEAAEDGAYMYTLLERLFGKGLRYSRDGSRQVQVELIAAEGDKAAVVAHLPEPLTLASGRLIYPNVVYDLAAAREHVGVRLLDYRSLRELEPDKRLAIIKTLARTEANSDPKMQGILR